MLRKTLAAVSAAVLLSAPVAAQSIERSAAPVSNGERIGENGLTLPGALAIFAVWAVGVFVIVEGGDDDVELPVSP